MAIALPNTFSKAELMVQKLTEIGVDSIYFRPSERSQLRDISTKKLERLEQISLEAVEQSRGWQLPHIYFSKELPSIDATYISFDTSDDTHVYMPSAA
jgi:RsmE family RNA methyltransferase